MDELIKVIKDLIDSNKEADAKTAKMLIQFKLIVHSMNKTLIKVTSKPKWTKDDFKIIDRTSRKIIFFISTWCIYIKQGIIDIEDISHNLSGFLDKESELLSPFLKQYLHDKKSAYHYDAKNCAKLFSECREEYDNND